MSHLVSFHFLLLLFVFFLQGRNKSLMSTRLILTLWVSVKFQGFRQISGFPACRQIFGLCLISFNLISWFGFQSNFLPNEVICAKPFTVHLKCYLTQIDKKYGEKRRKSLSGCEKMFSLMLFTTVVYDDGGKKSNYFCLMQQLILLFLTVYVYV